jgi:hypothetical protein
MNYNGKELKTETLKVTSKTMVFTTVKVDNTFWEQLDALEKEFKGDAKVEYSDKDSTDGGGINGFVFESRNAAPKNFEKRVIKALAKADAKVASDAIADEKDAKAYKKPILAGATNKYSKAMIEYIEQSLDEGQEYMEKKEYDMATCAFADVDDLVKLFNMLNKNRFETARKFVSHLDTSVRECIPEVIYRHLNDEEIDK